MTWGASARAAGATAQSSAASAAAHPAANAIRLRCARNSLAGHARTVCFIGPSAAPLVWFTADTEDYRDHILEIP